ncbi:hypothetical protein [Lachnospira hominis (ex Liu et al. 2021)]|jgi:hypothetical protein|uniref:Uncharacterized protein n=1 Tax=Lachnospira hominis (ex Liu et al. 2021) TaxID=2763051 RepID=A0ABR7G087_9FIRM|nr:hypothetical protein [Lachnospira hominis]MBC5680861.1 hypothetical protein [Lachnospira hominis]DAF15404.1 MAG TPA: hypothetical protein [Caudoviricetes sp.]
MAKNEELKIYDYEQSSLKQLLEQKIVRVLEDKDRYYVGVDSDYSSDRWDVVNKGDNKRHWTTIIDMFVAGVFDEAKEITPEEFRKRVS